MKTIVAILVFLGAAGCSTYSKKECRSFDWYQLGYRDARDGLREDRVSHYNQECSAEHGVQVDQAKYSEGHKEGLKYLCSPEGGLLLGQSGKTYQGTCPKDAEIAFMKTYDTGRLDYLTRRVAYLENEIRERDDLITNLRSQVSQLQSNRCEY